MYLIIKKWHNYQYFTELTSRSKAKLTQNKTLLVWLFRPDQSSFPGLLREASSQPGLGETELFLASLSPENNMADSEQLNRKTKALPDGTTDSSTQLLGPVDIVFVQDGGILSHEKNVIKQAGNIFLVQTALEHKHTRHCVNICLSVNSPLQFCWWLTG